MQKNSGVMTNEQVCLVLFFWSFYYTEVYNTCADEYLKKTHNKQNKNKRVGGYQFRIKGRGRAGASLATKYTTTLQHQVLSVCNL